MPKGVEKTDVYVDFNVVEVNDFGGDSGGYGGGDGGNYGGGDSGGY